MSSHPIIVLATALLVFVGYMLMTLTHRYLNPKFTRGQNVRIIAPIAELRRALEDAMPMNSRYPSTLDWAKVRTGVCGKVLECGVRHVVIQVYGRRVRLPLDSVK
ncbi:hypothetical protein Spp001_40 [Shewanella phage Spp001]|uniref:Uncharacterized protein n=1 Tax=Shewanella phage Spp001 TaxID=1445859 RepID=W6E890_9CAUD|nr:hypothetical protein Spp001_40 [Shewanella phage Spp001]AHJ10548.1 hypothetical protein Spp001_40 [Shewanella phage Spp001]